MKVIVFHTSLIIYTTHILFPQLFPYHLADYICRVLRVTPFKYYVELMYSVLRDERSYDRIPNFTVRAHHWAA